MNLGSKRATAAAVARETDTYSVSYRRRGARSSRRLQSMIGELLLCLQYPATSEAVRAHMWTAVERTIRGYWALVQRERKTVGG